MQLCWNTDGLTPRSEREPASGARAGGRGSPQWEAPVTRPLGTQQRAVPRVVGLGDAHSLRGLAGRAAHSTWIWTTVKLPSIPPAQLHLAFPWGKDIICVPSPSAPASYPVTTPVRGLTWSQGGLNNHEPKVGHWLPGRTWLPGPAPQGLSPRLHAWEVLCKPHAQGPPQINYNRIPGVGGGENCTVLLFKACWVIPVCSEGWQTVTYRWMAFKLLNSAHSHKYISRHGLYLYTHIQNRRKHFIKHLSLTTQIHTLMFPFYLLLFKTMVGVPTFTH